MKAITIRNIEPSVSAKLKQAAKAEGKSVNQFLVDMIKQNLGMQKKKRFSAVHNDLDHLFGRWSESEFDRIQSKIDRERKIDAELWK